MAPNFKILTFLLGPDMGPLDRGGPIQIKPSYTQPVLLVIELRVSYNLSLICLLTSKDIKNKILSHTHTKNFLNCLSRHYAELQNEWQETSNATINYH